MWQLVMSTVSWVAKNLSLIVGILEAIIRLGAGISSLTATKRDDVFMAKVDAFFPKVKKWLFSVSDMAKGYDPADFKKAADKIEETVGK